MAASSRRREQLKEFLRARRAALTPADVGLPAAGRRRSPGLRREEVAVLARVGVSWYTWLEQGRDINAYLHQVRTDELTDHAAVVQLDLDATASRLPCGNPAGPEIIVLFQGSAAVTRRPSLRAPRVAVRGFRRPS